MSCWLYGLIGFVLFVALMVWLYREPSGPAQPVVGCVFVTGADSGMGAVTAERLVKMGFDVAMGCFLDETIAAVNAEKNPKKFAVKLDVTSDESVAEATAALLARKVQLVGIVNCAGVAFEGPCEYFPLTLFQRQLDVNLLGYIRVTQALFPLLKAGVRSTGRRGRVVLVGTGGGVPAAMPAVLGAYMASKWGVEAWCQALRQEMKLRDLPIDALMVNPGTIKPTGLQDNGKANLERAWGMMPPAAKEEYGSLLDAFVKWGEAEPGTHPSAIADAMQDALTVFRPPLRYKVGPDSKAAPFAGLAPTWLREAVIRRTVFAAYPGPVEQQSAAAKKSN